MRRLPLLIASAVLATGGCAYKEKTPQPLLMENPLYAKRYYDELVENLVSITIHNDPVLQQKGMTTTVERGRRDAIAKAQETEKRLRNGIRGAFIPMEEYARGTAFLSGNTLHLSSDFSVTPGLSLHLFLTTAVDPRDVAFPDPSAVDLGLLRSAYGAQTFSAGLPADHTSFRTAVIFDTTLERLVSFAQLHE